MKNSPTMCQWFVAMALSPVRTQVPQSVIYHYMDDILIAAETQEIMGKALALTKDSVSQVGLQTAPEKVQRSSPWQYLG